MIILDRLGQSQKQFFIRTLQYTRHYAQVFGSAHRFSQEHLGLPIIAGVVKTKIEGLYLKCQNETHGKEYEGANAEIVASADQSNEYSYWNGVSEYDNEPSQDCIAICSI
jgi:hypothetical protein